MLLLGPLIIINERLISTCGLYMFIGARGHRGGGGM